MKISISFPPLESEKGVPLLTQNRQFQWFNSPTYIYPVIPAYAATLLKENNYEVFWDDAIAQEMQYEEWKSRIQRESPDIIAIETKTPVIERHWKIINELKELLPGSKIVLIGDHVTALPKESLEKSKADYIIASGDFDFLLLSIANYLTKGEPMEGGIWFRNEMGEMAFSGASDLSKHNLDSLPFIDRELTQWKLYAYKNGNFKYTPGAYMMSGRDCWWGRCAFCLTGETQVLTINGVKSIKDIEKGEQVLTHLGNYKKVNTALKRDYHGSIVEIKTHCLVPFTITPEHKILSLSKESLHLSYCPKYTEVRDIKKGDYLAVPINREIIKTDTIDLREMLNLNPTVIKTRKEIEDSIIKEILTRHHQGESERSISAILKIDRETVHRYIIFEKEGNLDNKINPIKYRGEEISFEGGKNWIQPEIALSKEVFRLFGYYLAEGCVSKIKNRPNSLILSFTFGQKEKDYIRDVKEILEESFKVKVNVSQNKVNHTSQITVGNTLLARVFKNLFGDDCYNKYLPEFVIKAEREKQVELLRGIFRGDAHYRRRGKREEYILSSVADNLSAQLAMVLLRCSAIPSVRKSKLRKKMTKPQNIITLFSVDIVNLFGEKQQAVKLKFIYKKGFIAENYAYLPVRSIKEENYKGVVYNLSVEHDHSYTANFIGVSNCSWTTLFPGKNFRARSAKLALDEVGQLIDLGVKEIMEDSGSLPIGNWLEEFCRGMIERGYNKKVVMSCNMRITGIRKLETWKLMKQAGFRFILFGLESANQETLDKINKNLKAEEIEPGLKMCKEGGLEPHITVMIGYPWETREMAQKTLNLARDLFRKGYVDTLQATMLVPYPGTPLYRYCKENDLLAITDYSRYDQRELVMKSPVSTEEAKELIQGLYRSFMTPQFIARKIFSVRSFHDMKFLYRAGLKVLGHLMDFRKT